MNSVFNLKLIIFLFFLFSITKIYPQSGNTVCKTRLPETINSYQPTIVPVTTIDGQYLYFDRKINPENIAGIKDKDDIWFSIRNGENSWSEPKNIGKPLNTFESDVLFSISPDGNKYLIYGIYKNNQKIPGFSITKKIKNGWETPIPLKIKNFYNDSSNFSANLSCDGRILMMAIHRIDSKGNLDLYVSFRNDSTGDFSEPMNLGDDINTDGLESSPFLAYDNKTLYFASNGLPGFGKLDLFMSRRLDNTWKKWSKPVNLGKDINTPGDENSIWLTALSDTAYIVSTDNDNKREGLYFVCLPDTLRPLPYAILTGRVLAIKSGFLLPVHDEAKFTLSNDLDTKTDTFYSNPESGRYYYAVPGGRLNNLIINYPNYEDFSFSAGTGDLDIIKFTNYDVILKPEKNDELLETVYFDTNVDELKPEYKTELDSIVNKVFDPKETRLLVVGHTDEVGSDSFNYGLSVRRARNTATYLETLGFLPFNIKIVGKGKTQPVSTNHDKNRRTEIFWEE